SMRKFLAVLMCLLLFGTLLAACSGGNAKVKEEGGAAGNGGGSSNTGQAEEPADDITSRKITIRIHYPLPDETTLRQQEDDKIARFQAKYPNVTIIKDDWAYDVNEIGVKMAANEAPTFYNTWATEANFLVERGWVADITELWNNWEYKDQMNEVLQSQFNVDGKVYGVTQNGYITSTVVNKKLVEDRGITLPALDWTWDDMYDVAKAAADPKKGISGIAPMGKGNEAGWNWTNFLFEAGGEIQSVDGGKVTATFNSDAGVKALEFYQRLRWEANAIPQDWALGWGDAVGAFAQGDRKSVV